LKTNAKDIQMNVRLIAAAMSLLALFPATSQAEMRIGVAGPFTGPNAAVGEQFRKGAERAAADMNANGGILGDKIELVFGDDASDPRQGVSVANAFAGQGVSFVIGHYNSGVSIPASDVYAENGILQITPGSTNPTFTKRGLWNTFRVCGRDDQQGAVAARHIARNFPGKRVAIIHDKTAYGVGISEAVRLELADLGGLIILQEGITAGEKDFSALVSKLKDQQIDVYFFGGLYTEAGLIVRQGADQGLKAVMVAGDGITSSEFGQIAGDAAAGTLMTFAPDPRLRPEAKAVVEALRAENFEPEAYTLYAYAALQVLKDGIEKTGELDAETVAQTLRESAGTETVLGTLAFDDEGDRRDEDYTIYVWKASDDGTMTYSMVD
jgi:branched-chain amino acid transport system substrate-binding protein